MICLKLSHNTFHNIYILILDTDLCSNIKHVYDNTTAFFLENTLVFETIILIHIVFSLQTRYPYIHIIIKELMHSGYNSSTKRYIFLG